jgi:hypothetical protein
LITALSYAQPETRGRLGRVGQGDGEALDVVELQPRGVGVEIGSNAEAHDQRSRGAHGTLEGVNEAPFYFKGRAHRWSVGLLLLDGRR